MFIGFFFFFLIWLRTREYSSYNRMNSKKRCKSKMHTRKRQAQTFTFETYRSSPSSFARLYQRYQNSQHIYGSKTFVLHGITAVRFVVMVLPRGNTPGRRYSISRNGFYLFFKFYFVPQTREFKRYLSFLFVRCFSFPAGRTTDIPRETIVSLCHSIPRESVTDIGIRIVFT